MSFRGISKLIIKKLYGCYDYDINFNEDINILYGENGCGKTTVLDIINLIFNGEFQKLIKYNFNEIKLEFYNDNYNIGIISTADYLTVNFLGDVYKITNVDLSEIDTENLKRKIDSVFSILYLDVERLLNCKNSNNDVPVIRKRRNLRDGNHNSAIDNVETIVEYNMMKTNYMLNKANDQFRLEILKSFSKLEYNHDVNRFLLENSIIHTEKYKEEVKACSEKFNKIITELKFDDEGQREFFNKYLELININNNYNEVGDLYNLLICHFEYNRINKIIKIAETYYDKKTRLFMDIDLFLNSVNKFIGFNDSQKKIIIDPNIYKLYFSTQMNKKININGLSAGEKQILIIFTYLIFESKFKQKGLFLIDEPELSLHLSWQKMFIQSINEANPNVQIILATHSPEIVGKFRNKLVYLEKHNSNKE